MKRIKLFGKYANNQVALIDDDDYEVVSKLLWRVKDNGYVSLNSSKSVYLHRFIMNPSKGEYVDHINRNKLDNRKKNLRICSNAVNNWNKHYKHNVGISKTKNKIKWRAYINIDSKQKWLGSFDSKKEAEYAYNEAVIKYRDSFSFLNSV